MWLRLCKMELEWHGLEYWSGHFFCCCVHLFWRFWLPAVQVYFICTNEPLQGRVCNEILLCTTPIHIPICNIISFIEKSSVCVHMSLFSYQFQFCAIIYGSKTKMWWFYSNLGPKLYAEYFHYILMNRSMKFSWSHERNHMFVFIEV